jgi:hypothetical protein
MAVTQPVGELRVTAQQRVPVLRLTQQSVLLLSASNGNAEKHSEARAYKLTAGNSLAKHSATTWGGGATLTSAHSMAAPASG